MSDPAPIPDPVPIPDPAPIPDPTPTPPLERPDYIPEKFWKDGNADVEGMAKSYRELETKFTQRKPADIPDSPDGYALKPDTLPEGVTWSDDAAKRFAGLFHEKGVPPEAARAITQTFVELEAENHKLLAEAYETQITEGTAALKKEWGKDYDARLGSVKTVVSQLGYDPADAALFSNPKVVSFLGKVVGMLSEDAVASLGGAAPGTAFTNGEAEAKAIMRDPKHPDYEAYQRGDRAAIAKVKKLIDG